jgi:hypothetical protein
MPAFMAYTRERTRDPDELATKKTRALRRASRRALLVQVPSLPADVARFKFDSRIAPRDLKLRAGMHTRFMIRRILKQRVPLSIICTGLLLTTVCCARGSNFRPLLALPFAWRAGYFILLWDPLGVFYWCRD